MEESLLSQPSSSSTSGPTRKHGLFNARRSDIISSASPYRKAAALVDLAEDGIGIPEQILDQSSFGSSMKLYFRFIQFNLIWSANYFALILLNFLEKPLWCGKASPSCDDRQYYFLGQLPYLTATESIIFEVVTLVVLAVHTLFPIAYEGIPIYWTQVVNKLKVLSLAILVADLVVYSLYLSPVAESFLPFRIAPYIRVVFFILHIRELRETMVILAGMLRTFLNILALGLLFLLLSSWLAYVMFEDTVQGKEVFTSYGTTLYQMFVLFTTSNNPDVWIPAYKDSRWYSLFFILYVLLGVYFVTNLILAVVYDSFKGQLAKQVSERDRMTRKTLDKAFSLIDKSDVGYLDKKQCIHLFEELNNYRTLPNISQEEFELIFDELDDSHDFKINKEEFADLCNAIALRFPKEDCPSCLEELSFYKSPFSQNLKAFVQSPKFGYIISFILIVNLLAVVVETTLDIENDSGQKVWQEVEFVFGWIYVLEMALKVYSYGFVNYWRDSLNRFDFLVTWIIVIGETITFASPSGLTFLSNGEWIRYLLIARMLRLIRLLLHVESYRAFIATFLTLIPSLMPYLGTIFCILCIYCSIGVQVFGGIVNAGNSKLQKTDLYEDDYLLFNFNDYPNGMVTLFNLVVMGNWQVWMQVIAFVLEAFFAEMDLEASQKSEEGNKDAGDGKVIRRYVGTKSRSQRVNVLLHHMLSSELSDSQPSDPPNP
ncbi:hypothetical protein ACFE04_031276 [Oxalis oulophora]